MLTIPELQTLESLLTGKDDDHVVILRVDTIRKLLRAGYRLEELDHKLTAETEEKNNYLDELKALSRHLTNLTLQIRCIECGSTILGKHGDTCPHCQSMLDVFFGVHKHADK